MATKALLKSRNQPAISRAVRAWNSSIHPAWPRSMATAQASSQKRAGDISDAFVSLSAGNQPPKPLDPRFAQVKTRLTKGKEDILTAAWLRLLEHLREEVSVLKSLGSKAIPEVDFNDVRNGNASAEFSNSYRDRGVCVVRNVIPEQEALALKAELRDYIIANPHTKAFPATNPQVYELYWSPSQVKARAHSNLLEAQRFLMSFWHADSTVPLSTQHPVSYADRLRMRMPGDATFALGPHIDGGSCERWEAEGYGAGGDGGPYTDIWAGAWEKYDAWDASRRLGVVSDLYQGVGACSMFRMAQGWLSVSDIAAGQGHLLVNPMLKGSTAYVLMRPFFEAKRSLESVGSEEYLKPSNWRLEAEPTSLVQGATPGHGQELNHLLHPHLDLKASMVHMPTVRPGDYVVWHCDTIHSVDPIHTGSADSSVFYIPVCPLTVDNAAYLSRQRHNFLDGTPSPDFGGGEGESRHVGRPTVDGLVETLDENGVRGMGLAGWDSSNARLNEGQRRVMEVANERLGFSG